MVNLLANLLHHHRFQHLLFQKIREQPKQSTKLKKIIIRLGVNLRVSMIYSFS
ncbi:hypothetical protein HanPSC8_Chr11g0501561 [Helianthus annuus]|nr:hypothetical protein HanPSC8_Chr11g0501561 [Helianthus annuus]